MAYENIVVETYDGEAVGLVALKRPKAFNSLCAALVAELAQALDELEASDDIGAIVVTGSDTVFSGGGDIKEMAKKTYVDAYLEDFITRDWERLAACRKPTIAAVAGPALGGGCELAMMCDIIVAADNARFGQPEISLGVPPGAGGTQRLVRAIGKSKAMEMCLTGRLMEAEEAERLGLVSHVVPTTELKNKAMEIATNIAKMSRPTTMMVKEAINRSFESSLAEGLRFERRLFHASFATEDQKEGMAAFIDKRQPVLKNR